MESTALQITWFVLFGVLIGGYAVLDGFDLGVGIISLFVKKDGDRRLMVNAIGPVWDGNEVWLLTGGGALFAAFPAVYATVFSGFYLAIMLLLLAMIARAVSMEFRGKVASAAWRRIWDLSLGVGSLVITVLFGVALGNIMGGIPLNEARWFTGTFLGLLNPYAIAVGLLAVAMFTTHGALYMVMKCDGELRAFMRRVSHMGWVAWVVLYLVVTVASFFAAPHLFENALRNPLAYLALIAMMAGLVMVPVFSGAGKPFRAFLASGTAVFASVALVGVGLFPRFVPASTNMDFSLTISNAASSEGTLLTMLIIALLGMPLVLGYTVFIYKVFKGKVTLDEHSY
jgi:cytochrome d ubiquinol oxidase subunit II